MNSYPDIIEAGDKMLRSRKLTGESRQVIALVVALAHRVQKDLGEDGGASSRAKAPSARRPGSGSGVPAA